MDSVNNNKNNQDTLASSSNASSPIIHGINEDNQHPPYAIKSSTTISSFVSDYMDPSTSSINSTASCNTSDNCTYYMDDYGMPNMKDLYGKRFIPYTILAGSCIIFNVLSLLAMARIRTHKTVHHVLLVNLAVCDIVGSALLWMYYNSPLLFPRFNVATLEQCLFITVVLVGPFILSLCNSLASLLMLALNQYMAICDPIFSATKVTKRKVQGGIAIVWLISTCLSSIPSLLMLFRSNYEECQTYVNHMSVMSIEICAYALAALIIIIVALYARIYRVVIMYRRATPPIRRNRAINNSQEAETNYKAFVTTLLLTGNLLFFWLPFMCFNLISAHIDVDTIPVWVIYVKFYGVDFLPVLNFLTDPIIYGIRMREIRLGYNRLCAQLLPCCIKEPRRRNVSRTTIRFTNLDTSTTGL